VKERDHLEDMGFDDGRAVLKGPVSSRCEGVDRIQI